MEIIPRQFITNEFKEEAVKLVETTIQTFPYRTEDRTVSKKHEPHQTLGYCHCLDYTLPPYATTNNLFNKNRNI